MAPLVYTSSTNTTVLPASLSRAPGANENAPATALARALAPSPRSTGVAFTRRSRSGAKGTPCARESDAAISPAWL